MINKLLILVKINNNHKMNRNLNNINNKCYNKAKKQFPRI